MPSFRQAKKRVLNMTEEFDVTQTEEGRGVFQFILGLIRTVVTAVVDMGKNLVGSLIEWVISAISAVVQRVIGRIASEVV